VALNHGDDPQWLLIGRVSDEIVADSNEAQRAACEIGTAVANMRKRNQGIDRRQNFADYPLGGNQVVGPYLSPNFIEIGTSFRVKRVSGHRLADLRRAAANFSRK
jgi:hypothetical protein